MTDDTRVAIVTGASRGIGASIAERLGRDGFTVIVNYAGEAGEAGKVVRRIESAGGRARAAQADISNGKAVIAMFELVITTFGGIDVVVNNAGVMALAPIAESDDAMFTRMVAINLRGTFNVLREAAKHIRAGGRIINVSSSQTTLLSPTYGIYAATKAAAEALTGVLAKELRGRQVTVNAVAPGPTETALFLEGKSEETVERLTKAAPLERLGQPDDIASAVSFLAGPDGAWVNAQIIRVNGGVV